MIQLIVWTSVFLLSISITFLLLLLVVLLVVLVETVTTGCQHGYYVTSSTKPSYSQIWFGIKDNNKHIFDYLIRRKK